MRTMSAAIQFTGRPKCENRPCTMTKAPSATIAGNDDPSIGAAHEHGRAVLCRQQPFRYRHIILDGRKRNLCGGDIESFVLQERNYFAPGRAIRPGPVN